MYCWGFDCQGQALALMDGHLGLISWFMSWQGSKLKKVSGRNFATSYENLVAILKMLVAKLIEAIILIKK